MELISLVEQAKQKLSSINEVTVNEVIRGTPVIDNMELGNIEKRLGIVFPKLLRDMYLNISNGIIFSWFAKGVLFGSNCNRGVIILLSPQSIEIKYNEMKAIVNESKSNLEELSVNQGLKALVNDWEHWIPIVLFPNGDAFCIEKRNNVNIIVFLEHDVTDGGPNLHGLRIANNFEELMVKWSRLYFVDIYDWTLGVNDEGIDLSKKLFENLLKI